MDWKEGFYFLSNKFIPSTAFCSKKDNSTSLFDIIEQPGTAGMDHWACVHVHIHVPYQLSLLIILKIKTYKCIKSYQINKQYLYKYSIITDFYSCILLLGSIAWTVNSCRLLTLSISWRLAPFWTKNLSASTLPLLHAQWTPVLPLYSKIEQHITVNH